MNLLCVSSVLIGDDVCRRKQTGRFEKVESFGNCHRKITEQFNLHTKIIYRGNDRGAFFSISNDFLYSFGWCTDTTIRTARIKIKRISILVSGKIMFFATLAIKLIRVPTPAELIIT